MDCKAFHEFLARRSYAWDEKILKDRSPVVFEHVKTEVIPPRWWLAREYARKLSEGLAYIKTELTEDDLEKVHIELPTYDFIGKWTSAPWDSVVGKPCNPSL